MASSRLSSLLNDLGDCLTTASDSSTSPQGSDAQLHTRMRTVLVSLLAECINSQSGTSEPQSCPLHCHQTEATASYVTNPSSPAVKERELVTLLNLVNMALQRIPRIVSDDDGATLLTIIGQTTSLLAEERLACVLSNMLLLRPHTESFCIQFIAHGTSAFGATLQEYPQLPSENASVNGGNTCIHQHSGIC